MTFHVPNQFRVHTGQLGSEDTAGNNGVFVMQERLRDDTKRDHGGKRQTRFLITIASDGEERKPIKGWENLYQISNLGEVVALPKTILLPHGGSRIHEMTLLSQEDTEKGYQRVSLCRDGETTKVLVHVLVAEAFINNPENYPEVNHIDGNKSHNWVTNLEWCSRKYNAHQAIELGLRTGITAKEIEIIKDILNNGKTSTQVADELGKGRQTISNIKFGRYRNLNNDEHTQYNGYPLWEHVSVHAETDDKKVYTPRWDEMCGIKALFWDETDIVIQYHPATKNYKNLHPHTLHLWRLGGGWEDFLPQPPKEFV